MRVCRPGGGIASRVFSGVVVCAKPNKRTAKVFSSRWQGAVLQGGGDFLKPRLTGIAVRHAGGSVDGDGELVLAIAHPLDIQDRTPQQAEDQRQQQRLQNTDRHAPVASRARAAATATQATSAAATRIEVMSSPIGQALANANVPVRYAQRG